jgi:hypothetical protein
MALVSSEDVVELGVGREGEVIEASSLVPLLEDEYPRLRKSAPTLNICRSCLC